VRIVIDLQGAQSPSTRERGIGRYSLGLAEGILRNRGEHDVHLAVNGAFPETVQSIRNRLADLITPDRLHVFDVLQPLPDDPADPRRAASELCREAFLARLSPDVVHISSLVEGMRGNSVSSIGRLGLDLPTSVTFYDAIPLIYPSEYLADERTAAWYQERIAQMQRADLLLAISGSSAKEAIEHLHVPPERVVAVGTAADPRLRMRARDLTQAGFIARLGVHRPYVMYTGGIDFRKNLAALLEGYAALPQDIQSAHQLVIACESSPDDRRRVLDLARQADLPRDAVILTGAVTDSELASLYSSAKLFVFPSLHEGFGLPVLEAMQCGAPVLGSSLSSIPEVIGLDEALFDPRDPRAIRNALQRALTDEAFLERVKSHSALQRTKFSWDLVGQRAIGALERLVDGRKAPASPNIRTGTKRRLAYVSPMPPAWSGIAIYSEQLLPHLTDFYDIDVVVETASQHVSSSAVAGVSQVIDPRTFLHHGHRYERVIYQIGNSEFHDYMVPLLEAVPGLVVLHDFYLGGLFRHRAVREGGERAWLRALYDNHGASAVFDCRHSGNPHEATSYFPCSTAIADRARAVIVHSSYAQRLAQTWFTIEPGQRLACIPLPCSVPSERDREVARERLGIASNKRLICSFGRMGPSKCNLDLLRAWRDSAASRDSDCTLVFVGAAAVGDYGQEIESEIAESELGDRVVITGWVNEESYRDYLATCDIAVQLRKESRGESSLTVLECLAYGRPTIANANGSIAELPDGILSMLPDGFEISQLRDTIDDLYRDQSSALETGLAGRAYIEAEHDPADIAARFHAEIERVYGGQADLPEALASYASALTIDEIERLAQLAVTATYTPAARRIFVDVSELDATAISRRRDSLEDVLRTLIAALPRHLCLRPIRYDESRGLYVEAHRYMAELLSLRRPLADEEPLDFAEGDTLLRFDATEQPAAFSPPRTLFVLDDLRDCRSGSRSGDDISKRFAKWLDVVAKSGGAICSSESLADELRACLADRPASADFKIMVAQDWLGGSSSASPRMALIEELLNLLSGSGDHSQDRGLADHSIVREAEFL